MRRAASEDERSKLAQVLPAYELGEVLGRGTFAVVYGARHVALQRDVAIKRLSPELVRDEAVRERFTAEARLLAALDHPHIVKVHDYVEEEDVCALVMERLRGGSLAQRARIQTPTCERACAIVIAALYGLEHAHRRGVLHRDVKPDNLLFGEHDTLKVADFGIAKVAGAQGARLTATAGILGTPAYMAPEQVSSSVGPLSPATDVWATGAVLYELLAGEPPLSCEGDLGDVLLKRITEVPRSLQALAPDVPPLVADSVMRSLERDPADRYDTAFGFACALEEAVGEPALAATGVALHGRPPKSADGTPAATVGVAAPLPLTRTTTVRRRRPSMRVVMAAVAAIAVAVGGALVALSPDGDRKSAAKAEARAGLPAPPLGWPSTLALGSNDPIDGPAGVAKRLGGDGLAYEAFNGEEPGPSKNPAKLYPAWFATEAHRHGLLAYEAFYDLRRLAGDGSAADVRKTLLNRRLMRTYWRNVRLFLQSLGSTGVPAAVVVEPSVWALMEQNLAPVPAPPSSVPAHVGDSGFAELRGLPDTLPGVARGWLALRNRYAPKVALGYGVNDYGTNFDISRQLPPRPTLVAAARAAGQFYVDLEIFDFASLEIAYSEEGQNPSRLDVYSPAEKEGVVTFVREYVRTTRMPMVLDSVPRGNSVMKTIDDKDFHWRDSWVQWLIGSDDFAGLRKLRDAGVIGIAFGVGDAESATCFCDAAKDGITNDGRRGITATSADDDGGYFAERTAALHSAGGLALAREEG